MLYVETPYSSGPVGEQDAYVPTATIEEPMAEDVLEQAVPPYTALTVDSDDDEEEEEEEEDEHDDQYESAAMDDVPVADQPFFGGDGLPTYYSDEDFEVANRAFHATIGKFSRQNVHGRRAAYSFLENWCLHSMYSKSQQILLGMPHVRPMVLLTGDDFMFTPPLLQHEDDEDEYYLDDHPDGDAPFFEEDVLDEDGIVIMSAPDPPPLAVMNENAWMKGQHHFTQPQANEHDDLDLENGLEFDENGILADDDELMHDHHDHHDHETPELDDDDQDALEELSPVPPPYPSPLFSQELIHWYRSTERGRPPSTIMEYPLLEDEEDDDVPADDALIDVPDACDASMDAPMDVQVPDLLGSVSSSSLHELQLPPPPDYGTTSSIVCSSASSSSLETPPMWTRTTSTSFGLADPLEDSTRQALAIAASYRQQPSITKFIACCYHIFIVFFFTAELMLANLWTSKQSTTPLLPL
ncbi:hypothetical protein BC940DRAFT_308315 [Gongronella butleri]|nr:hypothetical protein BC940DRAFT_308315 [Gongronella butleri]